VVSTATEIEVAERQCQLAVIAAQREAEERRISDQNVVEIDVFRRRRQAGIAKQAAELEAEAIRTLALANRDKALADAEGIQAQIAAHNQISTARLTADILSYLSQCHSTMNVIEIGTAGVINKPSLHDLCLVQ